MSTTGYVPLSRFPTVWQDLTLKVAADMPHAELREFVDKQVGSNAPEDTHIQLDDVSIYQAPEDQVHKNVTFRLHVTGHNRTLTDKEVGRVVEAVAAAARTELAAEQV
jgi:phenylalanyl-tRNA synthetase beta subunit